MHISEISRYNYQPSKSNNPDYWLKLKQLMDKTSVLEENSSYEPNDQLLMRTAQGHGYSGTVVPSFHFTAQAAAYLHSTAGDLARSI